MVTGDKGTLSSWPYRSSCSVMGAAGFYRGNIKKKLRGITRKVLDRPFLPFQQLFGFLDMI